MGDAQHLTNRAQKRQAASFCSEIAKDPAGEIGATATESATDCGFCNWIRCLRKDSFPDVQSVDEGRSWCRLQISILHCTAPVYPSIQRCWLGCSDRPSPRKNSIRVLLHQTLCYFVRAQAPGDATSSWRAARQLLTRKMSRAALRPTPSGVRAFLSGVVCHHIPASFATAELRMQSLSHWPLLIHCPSLV